MKFTVQLFGPLNQMHGTLEDKLRALAKAGITELEPCIQLGESPFSLPEDVFWKIDWVLAHKDFFAEHGLHIVSAHVMGEHLTAHSEELKSLIEATGLPALVLKTPQKMDAVGLQQAALNYMKLADELSDLGVEVWLHNEATDIQTRINGKTAYEALLDLCMGKVFAQVDVGWVLYGGEDPLEFCKRNAARIHAVHYKDFSAESHEPIDVPLCTGALHTEEIFRFAQANDLPQYIDQEHFGGNVPQELSDLCGQLNRFAGSRGTCKSFLNVYDCESGEVTVLAEFGGVIEAPNWLKKSDAILYNSEGRMHRYDLTTGKSEVLDTGACQNCNNDHVVSSDETAIAVSHMTTDGGFNSRVYIVPMGGGKEQLVTENSPSFLHGWSPDGNELAYCAFREIDGKQEVDVYTISAQGGEETRLTHGGFNDGPEYSPDGDTIWYNSTRSGLMQIWRMNRDGSEQTQVTKNARNNWFAHVSPDGKRVVYLSYGEHQLEPAEHLPNMPVELWMMNADGTNQHRILSLFGGQGSLNVNSWAGDSRRFAFVSYQLQ